MVGREQRVALAAIDSTGMESHHASRDFIRRRNLMLMVLTHNIMILRRIEVFY